MNMATPIATRVTILGATGSVGRSVAEVIAAHPDRFAVSAIVGGSDPDALAAMAKAMKASFVALADPCQGHALAVALAGSGIANGAGSTAVSEAVDHPCDLVVGAIAGTAGLKPTHAALKPGRRLALANKECLVCAGSAFMRDAKRSGVTILPVDSEHNALTQALGGQPIETVEHMTLTASGGPFRTWSKAAIAAATARQALTHPTWSMGAKITIDSSTLMNKGLELIEAKHLFGIDPARLRVVVHPQSIIHALVAFRDGAVTAGMAVPDMRIPIAHCLGLPHRLAMDVRRLDLAAIGALTFEPADEDRFPALALARAVLLAGGARPTVMNAANEIAVSAFLADRLTFPGISVLVAETCARMERQTLREPDTIEEALSVDHSAREVAQGLLPQWAETAS